MRIPYSRLFVVAAMAAMLAAPALAAPLATSREATSQTGLYIVQLQEPALASYTGGISGLEATSPQATGARRLDPKAPASQAYLGFLNARHSAVLGAIGSRLERQVEPAFRYTAALNGFAVPLSPAEAAVVAGLPGVKAVFPDIIRELDTDAGPLHLGAPDVWNGATGPGVATRGEGIVIGVIDSGINSQHPSFAATDGDGYTHTNPYGAGVYKGWCVANPSFCNSKLIAAYGLNPVGGNPEDTDGHGSHTASTASGNAHNALFTVGSTPQNVRIQGVAPRANIVAYKVCNPGCPSSASVSAVNSAILNDDVDVLNYSISGSDFPWNDAVDLAFLDASNAGIFVSASAGNQGPGAGTVAKTGPWNAAVANMSHGRVYAHTLDVTGPTAPAALQGLAAVPGENVAIGANINGELRYDPTNNTGCTAFPAGYFTGALALIQRGGCTFATKVTNAANAGATGVVLFQSTGGPPIVAGGVALTPPSVMLDREDGLAVRDYVVANPGATVRINAAISPSAKASWTRNVSTGSSRGPSQYELIKPDYGAPGSDVLAAVAASGGNPVRYDFYSGTSMSSPHGAGAAALLMALNPTWSPAEVKSALAGTATGGLFKEDHLTSADPFDVGSGFLAVGAAANVGLVMHETGANYAAANPALGGDPKTLNQPSMASYNCAGSCSWTRTVRSVLPDAATFTASVSAPPGLVVTVTPNNFTIPAGGTQTLTITADVTGLPLGSFVFADVTLATTAVWPTGSGSGTQAVLLEEAFTDATFPPAGWASYKLQGGGTATWIRDTAQSFSAPASARRIYGGSADGYQDDWLVTPPLALQDASLSYVDRGQWMGDYGYSGVWISTGSCNPADGQFVELLETADIPNVAWRATPVVIDLAAYNGQTACLAFRYGGDFAHTWWIDDVVVTGTVAGVTEVASTHLPLAVIPAAVDPVIDVTPGSLAASQLPDTTSQQILTIANTGGGTLNWDFETIPSVVLWDQPVNGGSGIVSDYFIGSNAGAYSASDFVLAASATLEYIYAAGFDNSNTLSSQPAINWAIYADAGGVPAGHPEDGTAMASALWSYSSPVNGPGVDITDNDIALDLVAAGQVQSLNPGTYWLTVYPSYNVTGAGGARWNWYQAELVGAQTHLVSPVIFGVASWTSLGALGVTFFDTAFRIEGSQATSCDNPADVPWLSVAPTAGSTASGGSSPVTVVFDSTGLAPGLYEALLCVGSNDPTNPLVQVPVSLTVQPPELVPNIDVDPLSMSSVQPVNSTSQQTLHIANTGDADLTWTIAEELTMASPTALRVIRPTPREIGAPDVFTKGARGPEGHAAEAPQPAADELGDPDTPEPIVPPETIVPWNMTQAVLYDNGPFITSTGDGPGGADVSLLQNVSLGMTLLGAAANLSAGGPHFRIADEFTVASPLGWSVDGFVFYGYQTGSSTTSSFTGVNYRIWDGPPNDPGSTVVYGDTTTNRLADTGWTNVYRYAENSVGTTRPIMYIEAAADVFLPQGTYWLDWQLAGSIASGPWQPPITVIGQTTTGNALQLVSAGWQNFNDGGTGTQQGAPFTVTGMVGTDCIDLLDIPWLSTSLTGGTTSAGASTPVTVTFDSTGLALGTYTGNLCVFSNDPDPGPGNGTSLVVVPVNLEVTQPTVVTVTVVVGTPGGGTVTGGGPYNVGDMATVEAFPTAGWVFLHWLVNSTEITDNPYTFEVTGDVTLTAIFQRQVAEPIPTTGTVGLILLLGLLLGVGVFVLRRMA